jgi:hypothetical protein
VLIFPSAGKIRLTLIQAIDRLRKEAMMKIHPDLIPGHKFPDFQLPDQEGNVLKLTQRMRGWPMIIVFYRGIW